MQCRPYPKAPSSSTVSTWVLKLWTLSMDYDATWSPQDLEHKSILHLVLTQNSAAHRENLFHGLLGAEASCNLLVVGLETNPPALTTKRPLKGRVVQFPYWDCDGTLRAAPDFWLFWSLRLRLLLTHPVALCNCLPIFRLPQLELFQPAPTSPYSF